MTRQGLRLNAHFCLQYLSFLLLEPLLVLVGSIVLLGLAVEIPLELLQSLLLQ